MVNKSSLNTPCISLKEGQCGATVFWGLNQIAAEFVFIYRIRFKGNELWAWSVYFKKSLLDLFWTLISFDSFNFK